MRPYASGTIVSAEKSKAEIDMALAKFGAGARGVMCDDAQGKAIVYFAVDQDRYQLTVPLPRLPDFPRKGERPRGFDAWSDARQAEWRYRAYEQACRERWRAVLLMIRSKIEIVRLGMSSARREFMADLVLANGKTVHELMQENGDRLLPAMGGTSQ